MNKPFDISYNKKQTHNSTEHTRKKIHITLSFKHHKKSKSRFFFLKRLSHTYNFTIQNLHPTIIPE